MFWFVMLVLFILVEANTVTLVSSWFAAGALIAMIVSFFGAPIWLQAVLFFVISIVLLAAFRPLAKKYFTPKLTKTNVDSIIGMLVFGMCDALQPAISYCYGAGLMEKVRAIFRRIIIGAVVLSTASMLFMMFLGPYVAPIFIKYS